MGLNSQAGVLHTLGELSKSLRSQGAFLGLGHVCKEC